MQNINSPVAQEPKRIIVGISGASGALYGLRALDMLKSANIETHLIITRAAYLTLKQELGLRPAQIAHRASVCHNVQDIGASIASGSYRTMGMLIAPCSVRTMSEIATGVTSSLMSRAADVVLKERRLLVLMLRETPLHLGHLRSMTALAEMGAVIMPPVPALYSRPQTIDEMVDHSVGRALDLFGLDTGTVERWQGMNPQTNRQPAGASWSLEQFPKSRNRFSDKNCGEIQELEHSPEQKAQAKNALADDESVS